MENFSSSYPSKKTAVEIFKGQWASHLPEQPGSGTLNLFYDARIQWLIRNYPITDKGILELGTFEAGHTWMLSRENPRFLYTIESRRDHYLKSLCVKEMYGMQNVEMLYGDFRKYLRESETRFDLIVASGVLYHMEDPISLLSGISRVASSVYIWTHYISDNTEGLDYQRIENNIRFFGKTRKVENDQNSSGFYGGEDKNPVWLTKSSILSYLSQKGYKIKIHADSEDHPNGPSISFLAQR